MSSLIPSLPLFPGTELLPRGAIKAPRSASIHAELSISEANRKALWAIGWVAAAWVAGLLLSSALAMFGTRLLFQAFFSDQLWLTSGIMSNSLLQPNVSPELRPEFWLGWAFFMSGLALAHQCLVPWLARNQNAEPWNAKLSLDEFPEAREMISLLCAKAHIAIPNEIRVSFEANAGLELGSACAGKLNLNLGFPIWLGLSPEQKSAVLAHELGHFKQGQKLQTVLWLQQLCHLLLPGMAKSHYPLWYLGAQAATWLQQRCMPLLHALERDADDYARQLIEGNSLDTAMLKLRSLEQASAQALRVVQAALAADALPENLVEVLAQELKALGQPLSETLERRALANGPTSSHPSLRDRLAEKQKHVNPGIESGVIANDHTFTPSEVHHETQSKTLFKVGPSPFEEPNSAGIAGEQVSLTEPFMAEFSVELSKTFSESFYEHELGSPLPEKRLTANDARCLLTSSQDTQATLEHYFYGLIREAQPIRPLPGSDERRDGSLMAMNAPARLPLLRKSIASHHQDWRELLGRFTAADDAFRQATLESLGGCPPAAEPTPSTLTGQRQAHSDDLRAGRPGFTKVNSPWQMALNKRQAIGGELHAVSAQLSQQLDYGLSLLSHPDVNAVLPEAGLWRKVVVAMRVETQTLARMLTALEAATPSLIRLANLNLAAANYRSSWEVHERRALWQALSLALEPAVRQPLSNNQITSEVAEALGACGRLPCDALVEKIESLYLQLSQAYLHRLGILAFAAGKAEIAMGIRPWE